jgi:phage-related holin
MLMFLDNFFGIDVKTAITHRLDIVAICFVAVLLAMIIDLFSGVYKAKKNGEFTKSESYKRTVSKFVLYFSALSLAFLADVLVDYIISSFHSFIPIIPYFSLAISLFIIVFVEGKSVFEKAPEKQRKQVEKDAIELFKIIAKLKDSDIINKLIDKYEDGKTVKG